MISKEEERAFYEIMGGLGEEAEKIESKIDSQNKAKIALFIILAVFGVITMIVAVSTDVLILGILGFAFMFTGGYFVSKFLNI